MKSAAAIVFITALCTAQVVVNADTTPSQGARISTEASDWTVQLELARYAQSNAASFRIRQLGKDSWLKVRSWAGAARVSLPAPLSNCDRKLVQRIESLVGDDFDIAYMDFLRGGCKGSGR